MELEITRRAFLALAATVPLAASLPECLASEEGKKEKPVPPVDEDLPISGLAGECSGRW